ncbi:hypothetical protein ASG90_12700 [Nocardioides sp. Soil797]|nr:hypothetical protein ASG90_12700 [Nocardioides sp. Soil797]
MLSDAPTAESPASTSSNVSTADLLRQMSDDTRRLIKDEIGLAQLEMKDKAKHVGMGAGLFGTAGILALFGFGALIATVIIALSLVMDAWLAALIVTVVLFVVAAVAGVVGKKQVTEGTPAKPEQTLENVKKDVDTLKGARS